MCERRKEHETEVRLQVEHEHEERIEDMEFSVFFSLSSVLPVRPSLLLMGCAAGSPSLIHLKAFLEIKKGAGSEETEPAARWKMGASRTGEHGEQQIFFLRRATTDAADPQPLLSPLSLCMGSLWWFLLCSLRERDPIILFHVLDCHSPCSPHPIPFSSASPFSALILRTPDATKQEKSALHYHPLLFSAAHCCTASSTGELLEYHSNWKSLL